MLNKLLLCAMLLPLSAIAKGECNCIVIPNGQKYDIKCDVPSIIVFTTTMPEVTPANIPKEYPTTQPKPAPKPAPVNPWGNNSNSTIGIDPATGRYIFK